MGGALFGRPYFVNQMTPAQRETYVANQKLGRVAAEAPMAGFKEGFTLGAIPSPAPSSGVPLPSLGTEGVRALADPAWWTGAAGQLAGFVAGPGKILRAAAPAGLPLIPTMARSSLALGGMSAAAGGVRAAQEPGATAGSIADRAAAGYLGGAAVGAALPPTGRAVGYGLGKAGAKIRGWRAGKVVAPPPIVEGRFGFPLDSPQAYEQALRLEASRIGLGGSQPVVNRLAYELAQKFPDYVRPSPHGSSGWSQKVHETVAQWKARIVASRKEMGAASARKHGTMTEPQIQAELAKPGFGLFSGVPVPSKAQFVAAALRTAGMTQAAAEQVFDVLGRYGGDAAKATVAVLMQQGMAQQQAEALARQLAEAVKPAPAAGLFGQGAEPAQPAAGGTDLQRIEANRQPFVDDFAREMQRVFHAKRKARAAGKRSAAIPNIKRLAAKYGLSAEGQDPLDLMAGAAIFDTLNWTSSTDIQASVETIVNDFLAGQGAAERWKPIESLRVKPTPPAAAEAAPAKEASLDKVGAVPGEGRAQPTKRTAPQTKEAREPWQMTRAEVAESVRRDHFSELGYKGDDLASLIRTGQTVGGASPSQGVALRQRTAGVEHFYAVEQAVAAGKPVPPAVLADYPDLAKAAPAKEAWEVTRAEVAGPESMKVAPTPRADKMAKPSAPAPLAAPPAPPAPTPAA
ncbi:MAG TPA: hypothetical protein VMY35_16355, partial [Phycisphaerae bacterium]|nr:hypothetical protein [Phycisphaerae bacterium]